MENLDGQSRWQRLVARAAKEFARHECEHGADAFATTFERIANGLVEFLWRNVPVDTFQLLFDVVLHDSLFFKRLRCEYRHFF